MGDGWTRDINQSGAYIYSACCPPAGTHASVTVLLPPLGEAGRMLKIQMDAYILRVEPNFPEAEYGGFAVRCMNATVRQVCKNGSEETIEDFESDKEH